MLNRYSHKIDNKFVYTFHIIRYIYKCIFTALTRLETTMLIPVLAMETGAVNQNNHGQHRCHQQLLEPSACTFVFCHCSLLICYYLPLKMEMALYYTKFHLFNPVMLFAKFGWNQPCVCGKEAFCWKFVTCNFYNFVYISPWRKCEQSWPLTSH